MACYLDTQKKIYLSNAENDKVELAIIQKFSIPRRTRNSQVLTQTARVGESIQPDQNSDSTKNNNSAISVLDRFASRFNVKLPQSKDSHEFDIKEEIGFYVSSIRNRPNFREFWNANKKNIPKLFNLAI